MNLTPTCPVCDGDFNHIAGSDSCISNKLRMDHNIQITTGDTISSLIRTPEDELASFKEKRLQIASVLLQAQIRNTSLYRIDIDDVKEVLDLADILIKTNENKSSLLTKKPSRF